MTKGFIPDKCRFLDEVTKLVRFFSGSAGKGGIPRAGAGFRPVRSRAGARLLKVDLQSFHLEPLLLLHEGLAFLMKDNSQRTAFSQFPNTQWSLVEQAQGGPDDLREEALELLCQTYWLPLYSFARRKGQTPADAEDSTQGFLASFLSRGDFSRPKSEGGKMRTYLLHSFTNFLNGEYRSQSRVKRGGGVINLSIQDMESEGRYHDLPLEKETPESLFDRVWAMELLERVLGRLKKTLEEKGKGQEFELLKPFLNPSGDEPSHQEVAAKLKVEPNSVKTMIFRLRRQYRDRLHEVVKETLVEGANVDDEIKTLVAILGE